MIRVELHALEIFGYHGVEEHERRDGQPFLFDIEIVFLYPWAVAFDQLGTFALVEMALFMLTVFVAYAYVWRRGGLEWD